LTLVISSVVGKGGLLSLPLSFGCRRIVGTEKNLHFGKKIRGKSKMLSTLSEICYVRRKIGTVCPTYFLKPRTPLPVIFLLLFFLPFVINRDFVTTRAGQQLFCRTARGIAYTGRWHMARLEGRRTFLPLDMFPRTFPPPYIVRWESIER